MGWVYVGVCERGGLQQRLEQGRHRWQQQGRAEVQGQRLGKAECLSPATGGMSIGPVCISMSALFCLRCSVCLYVHTAYILCACLHMLTGNTCLGSLRVGPGDTELLQPAFS